MRFAARTTDLARLKPLAFGFHHGQGCSRVLEDGARALASPVRLISLRDLFLGDLLGAQDFATRGFLFFPIAGRFTQPPGLFLCELLDLSANLRAECPASPLECFELARVAGDLALQGVGLG